MRTHTHLKTHVHTHVHVHTYTCIHELFAGWRAVINIETDNDLICVRIYTYICIRTHTYTLTHKHIYMYTYIYLYVYIHIYIYIYMYIYIHIYMYTLVYTHQVVVKENEAITHDLTHFATIYYIYRSLARCGCFVEFWARLTLPILRVCLTRISSQLPVSDLGEWRHIRHFFRWQKIWRVTFVTFLGRMWRSRTRKYFL